MALPSHLSRKLRQALGPDAGGDFVTWLDEMRAEHGRLLAQIDASEARLADRLTGLQTGLQGQIRDLDQKLDNGLARLEVKIGETKADLMKWSFVFWVGAVAAIAMLAGVLP